MKKIFFFMLVLLMSTQLFSACTQSQTDIDVIVEDTQIMLNVGEKYDITFSVTGDGTKSDVTFVSSDTSVVTVDHTGTVTAVAPGIATITVSIGEETGKIIQITVNEKMKDYPVISGSFIQNGAFLDYSDTQLSRHFDYLQEVGIKYLVLSTSAFVNSDGTFADIYYPSQMAMDNKGTNFDDKHSDMTERMLRACQEHGIKVYISPAYSNDGWTKYGISDPDWYVSFAQLNVKVAREIYDLYSEDYGDVMYGWYFVPEFANYFEVYNDGLYSRAADMLNICINGFNDIDPEMPFLMSPYFADFEPYSDAAETAAGWDRIFSQVSFRQGDIFCPQDCVGSGLAKPQTYLEYYTELKKVVDKYPALSFWGNPENFKQSDWTPAPITRYVWQLKQAAPLVDGFISFAYSHYYAPDVIKTAKYHEAYKHYYETGEVVWYGESDSAKPEELTFQSTVNGVRITASFGNCKYGISYVEIYRGEEKVAVINTPFSDCEDSTLFFTYCDAVSESGSYSYTVRAVDYLNEQVGELCGSAEITVSECISVGCGYTTDYSGVQTYPDDGVRLTDGKFAQTDLYSDSAASGFADVSSVSFVIDLGELHSISTVVARGLSSGSGGAIISSQVAVSFSETGTEFTSPLTVDAAKSPVENGYSVVEIETDDVLARYVKIEFVGLRNWLFIDELSVYS